MTVVVSLLAGLVLAHVYLLGLGIYTDQFYTFWLPIVIMGFLVFYGTLQIKSRFPLILILILALTLHLVPIVSQPANMGWDYGSIYALPFVNHVVVSGHWDFSYGAALASGNNYYPLMFIFQSILSMVTSFTTMTCIKYSMAIINLLTLLGLYALVKGLFKLESRTANLVLFFFCLNPSFNGFDSYPVPESFAIIFFPLILLYVLRQVKGAGSRSASVVAILMLVTVAFSHHFTSYMVAFSLLGPAFLLYLSSREFVGRKYLHLLAIVLPWAWLTFVASWILEHHVDWTLDIIRGLTSVQAVVGYNYSPAISALAFYPSEFSMHITLLRNVLLIVFPIIGFFWYSNIKNRKAYSHFKFLLLLYLATTIMLLYFVDWTQIRIADIRDRIVAFAYFPIALFFPLGLEVISRKMKIAHKYLEKKSAHALWKGILEPSVALIFIIVFLVPTVLNAFPRFMYDSTYSYITSTEYAVAPEEQYRLGLWVNSYLNSSLDTVFTGSISSTKYVFGYGLFQGTWSSKMLNAAEIPAKTEYSIFYVVNIYNLQLPDQYGQKLNTSTLVALNEGFGRLYDNGAIVLFERPPVR